MRKFVVAALALLFVALVAAVGVAQTALYPMPTGIGTTGQVLAFTNANNVQGTSALTAATSITVGAGTAITKMAALTATITGFQIAPNTCVVKAYTVTGLTTADKVFVNPTYDAVEAGINNARVAAENSLEVTFCNTHGATVDPEAGTLNVLAIRS